LLIWLQIKKKNPGNPNKKEFLFGLSTQKLKNPGNQNKNYEIREIQVKKREIQIKIREIQIINIEFVKSE
jgi:hypothetical protein